MSAAVKNQTARMKRAKLIAAMGLVSRDENGFNVKSPSRGRDSYRVWRDEKGRVRCSCAEFAQAAEEDIHYRCEHILAVKYHLEPPNEEAVMQLAPTSETGEDEGSKPEPEGVEYVA